MTDSDDMKVLRRAADRLCIGFAMAHLQTPKEVVQALLQFTGGRLPSSAEEMRTRLLSSYANLVCIDIETALTDSDVEQLFLILKKYAN